MANPPCMSGDGREASMVATMLQTGDGFALCDECIVPWAAGLLSVMTGVDMEPFLLAASAPEGDPGLVELDPPPDPTLAELRAESKQATPVKRGRSSNGSRAAGTASDPGADGPATPASTDSPAA